MKIVKCRVFQGARVWSLVLLALGPTGCAQLQASKPGAHDAEDRDRETVASDGIAAKPDGVSYKATFTGVEDKVLLELLESSSQLHALTDRPPSGLTGLRRRADGDLDRLQTALRSEGFYGAEVRYDIDRGVSPIAVTIEVSTGPRYVIGDYDVSYEKSLPPATNVQPGLADLGLHVGMAGRAPTIVAAQRALLTILAQRGYPLAEVLERKVQVDHATRTMTVALKVDAGPFARFGAVIVRGLRDVDEDYARSLLTWSQGDPFDRTMVESSRAALSATGLFGSVIITPGTEVGPREELPVTVTLNEAKHRSFGFGFSYSTSEGVGGNVFWQHRNLLGRNEQLLLGLTTAEIEQVLDAELRKPNFLRRDQAFLANSVLANRNTDAFDEKSVSSFVGLVMAGLGGCLRRVQSSEGQNRRENIRACRSADHRQPRHRRRFSEPDIRYQIEFDADAVCWRRRRHPILYQRHCLGGGILCRRFR
jgi:translocation and assembly module TamA